jgi:hypothetical protein
VKVAQCRAREPAALPVQRARNAKVPSATERRNVARRRARRITVGKALVPASAGRMKRLARLQQAKTTERAKAGRSEALRERIRRRRIAKAVSPSSKTIVALSMRMTTEPGLRAKDSVIRRVSKGRIRCSRTSEGLKVHEGARIALPKDAEVRAAPAGAQH